MGVVRGRSCGRRGRAQRGARRHARSALTKLRYTKTFVSGLTALTIAACVIRRSSQSMGLVFAQRLFALDQSAEAEGRRVTACARQRRGEALARGASGTCGAAHQSR